MNIQFRFVLLFVFAFFVTITACKKKPTEPTIPDDWVYNPTPYQLEIPFGFPPVDFEKGNPMTKQGVELGRRLYYDPIIHSEELKACATCHLQDQSFTSDATVLPHLNLAWNKAFLWNGKIQGSVEDIMDFEVKDFFETDVSKLNANDTYRKLFYEAFGVTEITQHDVAKGLAQFIRTIITGNSRYDKVMRNEEFFTQEELSGYNIFFTEVGDCFHCHGTILFTDNGFHNTGLDSISIDHGLMDITSDSLDWGKFKSPTMRNLVFSAPYMHDGRFSTLEEVLDFYSEGIQHSPTIDPLMKKVLQGGVQLNPQQKSDLKAFLLTLTDSTVTKNPALSDPF
jgi:cytochrome c peroxidase